MLNILILGLKSKIRTNYYYQVKVIYILRLNCQTVRHINMERILDLIKNAIMYLFDRVSYKLSEREIEGY